MAAPMHTPGALIVENVVLVSGSPTAFTDRYGHLLTSTTFAKPGTNVPAANAVLHFLVCAIDPDAAACFKPCFPILDREQERDFRKVIDARLAILEKAKLIPAGAARKSIVSSGGGDKFLDLLWSLSVLAVQQACLRHPTYGSTSRLRLMSQNARTDSNLTHQSSARSTRSLMSTSSRTTDRADPSRQQRRFLGAGMVSTAQQRSKDAEEMRARISAERAALARTTQAGQQGAKTWATEADSLREKIGDFEAKIRRLKDQLADMGFDQNGIDIRKTAEIDLESGHIPPSSSGDDLRALKTSPIESMESGSSVDELLEPSDNVEVVSDFPKLMAFTAETSEARADVERAFLENTASDLKGDIQEALTKQTSSPKHANPEHIVDLVRAATDELEQATNRMGEIQEARKRTEKNIVANTFSQSQPSLGSSDVSTLNPSKSLKELIESSVQRHSTVAQSSKSLSNTAIELTQRSQHMRRLPRDESDDSLRTIDPVATISKPNWVSEATADASQTSYVDLPGLSSADGSKCSSADEIDTTKDVNLVTQALQNSSPNKALSTTSTGSSSRRVREARRSSERRQQKNRAMRKPSTFASREQAASMYVTPTPLASKNSRSVRFAALPPSYSANRSDFPSALGVGRHATEVFPSPVRLQRVTNGEKVAEPMPLSRRHSEADVADGGVPNARTRRPEKTAPPSRKMVADSRKSDQHRRTPADEKASVPRRGKMPTSTPLVPRTQTPRRIVRRKEVLQRSFISQRQAPVTRRDSELSAASSIEPRNAQNDASTRITSQKEPCHSDQGHPGTRSALEEIADLQAASGDIDDAQAGVTDLDDAKEVKAVESTSSSAADSEEDVKSIPDESDSSGQSDASGNARDVENEKVAEQTPRPSEINTVPKRLFMTPETPAVPVPAAPTSSVPPKKPGFARRSIGSVLGRKQSPRTSSNNSTSPEPQFLPTASEDNLLFSHNPKLCAGVNAAPSVRSADGFFAGQTAGQWQQGAPQRRSTGLQSADSSRRPDSNNGFLSSRSRGHSMASSSARKSRVQSLKARLAAALK